MSTEATPSSDLLEQLLVTGGVGLGNPGDQIVKTVVDDAKEGYNADQLNFVMSGVIAPFLCIPGMIGNLLAVAVWNRPSMASSTGRYLTAQAMSDFAVLFFYFFNDCLQAWEVPLVFEPHYGYYFSYVGFPIYFFFIILHVWSTVGVTVDLCFMVCCILKAKTYCKTKVANIYITILTIVGFLMNIPHFFNFRPVTTTDTTTITNNNHNNTSNNTGSLINNTPAKTMSFALTEFGSDDRGMYYEFSIHCILLIMIPWTSVFVMNVKVIHKIARSNQRMADKKSSQSVKNSKETEGQITRLLLGVSFSYLFFVGINCGVHCFWMMEPPQVDRDLVVSCFMFAKTGFIFNAASHFFFYCILGKRFRHELGTMLCLKSLRNKNLSLSLLHRPKTSTTGGCVESGPNETPVNDRTTSPTDSE